MENIDDFMQRKFDSDDPASRFPFREEYWEQAQALIEADERRKKRRRLLFWWCSAGALAGIAVLWLWLGKPVPTDDLISSHPSDTVPATERKQETAPLPTTSNNTPTQTRQYNASNAAPEQNEKNGLKASENKELNEDFDRNDRSIRPNSTEKNGRSFMSSTAQHKNLKSFQNTQPLHAPENAGVQKSNSSETDNFPINASISNQKTIPNNSVSRVQTADNTSSSRVESADNTSSDMPGALAFDAPMVAKDSIQVLKQVTLLDLLALPFAPAKQAKKKTSLPRFPYQPMPIKPVVDKRFAFEASADISAWKAGPGFAGQLTTTYALNNRWKVFAGVQYRYLPLPEQMSASADSAANTSVQYKYSFGLERLETRRIHQAMNTLEIPVGIRWQRGRLGISAGLAPGFLLSVKDRLSQIRETTLGGVEELDGYSGLGEKTGFQNTYLRMSLSAEWRILPQLGLHIQGNYRPGSILTPSEASTPDKNFWYGDAGVCWHF
ncbi:MAG: hypothetical protein LCH81_13345 [Bacteroidetes bacterium]|nr:hypothetical protein [Bacteroidota bacterium]